MGLWELIYFVGVYLAFVICFISAFKIGKSKGWFRGLLEVLILVGFAVAYWLLESKAHISAPFYVYPDVFPDMVDFYNFSPPSGNFPADPCTQHGHDKITLTVPLLEASMTYCLMWTAKLLLKPQGWENSPQATAIAPFIVGLMALALDGYLDPIVSQSFTCSPLTLNHPGIGFWQWFADSHMANIWYGIPMFNYGAWYAAPVILVTVVMLINWLYKLFLYVKGLIIGPAYPRPSFLNGFLQLAIILAFIALRLTMPGANPPYIQVGIILVAILISFVIVATRFGTYDRDNPFRWEFVVPLMLIFLMPLPMLLFSGIFDLTQDWLLLLVTLGLTIVGMVFAFSPYSDTWLLPSHSPRHTAEVAASSAATAEPAEPGDGGT